MGATIQVTSKSTGQQVSIDADTFNPGVHDLVGEQQIAVRPAEAGAIQTQAVTPEGLGADAFGDVSGQELVDVAREAGAEERAGGIGAGIAEFGRGVLSGATFGISDVVLRPETELRREEARERRDVQAKARFAGELFGGIAPALASGGAGTVGAVARLTPSGLLAANTARFVSGSKGLASRALRSIGASALEGGVESVGNQIANSAIQENPDLSAEAIASTFALGGVIGGGAAGVGEVLGAGFRRLRRGQETMAEKLERQFADVPAELTVSGERRASQRTVDDAAFDAPAGQDLGVLELTERGSLGEGFVTRERAVLGSRATASMGDVVGREARAGADDAARSLFSHVDDDATRAFGAVTNDASRLTSKVDDVGLPPDLADELRVGLGQTANDYLAAGNRARSWIDDVAEEVGTPPSKLTAKQFDGISDDLEDAGIAALAELDEAGQAWQRASSEVEGGLTDAVEAANRGAASGPAIGERFRAIADRIRSGGVVTTTVAAAETARDLGIDVPLPSIRDIPGVGAGLKLFVQAKALSRATGRVPLTATTRAARKVSSVRDSIPQAIRGATRIASRLASKPAVRTLTAKTARAAAREINEVVNTTPADVEASAHAAIDAPIAVKQAAVKAAVRAHDYLSRVAPKNPLAGTSAADSWTPTEQEQLDWSARRGAVRNPGRAIRESLGGGFPDLAVEALREVYPVLYEETRSRIQRDAPTLQKRLPEYQLQSIGRVYRVPMTLSQTRGYGAAAQAAFAQGAVNDVAAQERFQARQAPLRPVNPGTSAVSRLQAAPLSEQI